MADSQTFCRILNRNSLPHETYFYSMSVSYAVIVA